jgi:hypothetical protein
MVIASTSLSALSVIIEVIVATAKSYVVTASIPSSSAGYSEDEPCKV